VSWQWEKTVCP